MTLRPISPARDACSLRARWAFALGALVVSVQLAPLLHVGTAGHRVCAVHGELEHVDHYGPAGPPGTGHRLDSHRDGESRRPSEEAPDGPAFRRVRDARGTAAHEVCGSVALLRPDVAPPLPPPSSVIAPAAGVLARARVATGAHRSIDLLRLAPSHSPPA
jgi:hypothetical protein